VLFVYPGPGADLTQRANEFQGSKDLPEGFTMLLDPDYLFTNLYNLRWDAPRETAYPSTFVLDQQRKVRFALISKTHGGRPPVNDVLNALKAIQ